MKNYLFFLVALIFVGCSQKEVVYTVDNQNEKVVKQQDIKEEIFTQTQEEFFEQEIKNKLAIVFPSKVVGKYANNVINTAISQLLVEESEFDLEVINTYDENKEAILNAIEELRNKNYKNIIVLFTNNGLSSLQESPYIGELTIYAPLVNKKDSISILPNIVYGGIDYEEQIEKLNAFSNGKNTMFFTQSSLGYKLKNITETKIENISFTKEIQNNRNDYEDIVSNPILNNSTLFLNTSIIKTSILLSQLQVYETMPYMILSTQLNYSPLLVSLTQYPDRKNLLVANSIEPVENSLTQTAFLLDSDIVYNWVNYSTLIGVNYLIRNNPFEHNSIVDNQVEYRTTIYRSNEFGFRKLLN